MTMYHDAEEVFKHILERLWTGEHNWCQKSFFQGDYSVDAGDPQACCLAGALALATQRLCNDQATNQYIHALLLHEIRAVGDLSLTDFNDMPGRSYEEVRAVVARARAANHAKIMESTR